MKKKTKVKETKKVVPETKVVAPFKSYKTKSGALEIFKSDANDQFYFHIKSRNGRILCASETYTRMENLKLGVAAVIKICRYV